MPASRRDLAESLLLGTGSLLLASSLSTEQRAQDQQGLPLWESTERRQQTQQIPPAPCGCQAGPTASNAPKPRSPPPQVPWEQAENVDTNNETRRAAKGPR